MKPFQIPWFPVSASDHASYVDSLFLGLLVVSLGIVVLLAGLVLFNIIRYRAGSNADRAPMRISPMRIEIFWTSLSAVAFLGLFAWGASLYLEGSNPGGHPVEVYVVARQWMWEFRHPDGRREHNHLRVPAGRPVHLLMTSEDVIHSFFFPAVRMKQDVVPGRYVSLSFTPTRPGTYPFYCAEYCGTKHSAMIGRVTVMPADQYSSWLAAGGPLTSLAGQGEILFAERGCAGCHSPGASVHAPLLNGLYGRDVPLQDGSFAKVDNQYIHDSILLPLKQVAAGYKPVMPSFEGQLEETEILALIEYVKSLKPSPAGIRNDAFRQRPAPENNRRGESE